MRNKSLSIFLLLLVFASLFLFTRYIFTAPLTTRIFPDLKRPLVIAHRGGANLWPENTLLAFTRAYETGADVLELDVRPSSDGRIVVIHDETVERTSDGRGRVDAMTLQALKRLDMAYYFKPVGDHVFPLRGKGVTLPTLEELFRELPDSHFNIEIKVNSPPFAMKVLRLIETYGMRDRVLLASFHDAIVELLKRKSKGSGLSAPGREIRNLYLLTRLGLGRLHRPFGDVLQIPATHEGRVIATKDFIDAAHDVGQEVYVWTIDDPREMRRLLELGVDGIVTNRPDILATVIAKYRKQSGNE